ncbi:unnamed protein product [Mycena citricolor]|uniref:Uncharacterized protein n=1 Tax=Mycena citricolor TaxID=2018698 RepID=A0AAD2Q0V6_9AGAR|nr:unnamed protein product [Mycena citricolor]
MNAGFSSTRTGFSDDSRILHPWRCLSVVAVEHASVEWNGGRLNRFVTASSPNPASSSSAASDGLDGETRVGRTFLAANGVIGLRLWERLV